MTRARIIILLSAASSFCALAHAAQHVTLRNGFEVDCVREEPAGDRVRLYLLPSPGGDSSTAANYLEVGASQILRSEYIAQPSAIPEQRGSTIRAENARHAPLQPAEMHELLTSAGTEHNIDADLLASVVHAESGGRVHAVSRAGAQGLMQLMPSTAAGLGVTDTFAPVQNIGGGTMYLDQMLTRYHDNLALALAAYNAGPAAVDRYHGMPPFAETRAYVARVIREFNRRKLAGVQSAGNLQRAGG